MAGSVAGRRPRAPAHSSGRSSGDARRCAAAGPRPPTVVGVTTTLYRRRPGALVRRPVRHRPAGRRRRPSPGSAPRPPPTRSARTRSSTSTTPGSRPAFVDAHVHATSTGLALTGLDLTGAPSLAVALDRVAAAARAARGGVLLGTGWDDTTWPERPAADGRRARPGVVRRGGLPGPHRRALRGRQQRAARRRAGGPGRRRLPRRRAGPHRRPPPGPAGGVRGGDARRSGGPRRGRPSRGPPRSGSPACTSAAGRTSAARRTSCALLALRDGPAGRRLLGRARRRRAGPRARGGRAPAATCSPTARSAATPPACPQPYADAEHARPPLPHGRSRSPGTSPPAPGPGCRPASTPSATRRSAPCSTGWRGRPPRSGTAAVRAARHRVEHAEQLPPGGVAAAGRARRWSPACSRPSTPAGAVRTGCTPPGSGASAPPALNPYAAMAAAGVALALGSDAPVTPLDPWGTVRAAVRHRTPGSGPVRARGLHRAHPRRLAGRRARRRGRPGARRPGDLRGLGGARRSWSCRRRTTAWPAGRPTPAPGSPACPTSTRPDPVCLPHRPRRPALYTPSEQTPRDLRRWGVLAGQGQVDKRCAPPRSLSPAGRTRRPPRQRHGDGSRSPACRYEGPPGGSASCSASPALRGVPVRPRRAGRLFP